MKVREWGMYNNGGREGRGGGNEWRKIDFFPCSFYQFSGLCLLAVEWKENEWQVSHINSMSITVHVTMYRYSHYIKLYSK